MVHQRKHSRQQIIWILFSIMLLRTSFIIVSATSSSKKASVLKNHLSNKGQRLDSQKRTTSPPVRGGGTVATSPLQTLLAAFNEARAHLAAAAVARSSSLLACYPIDTVKTRIQTANPNPFSISGLYGGIASCLFGQIPYATITFGSYELYKKKLTQEFPTMKPILVYALSAVLGDLTGSGWLCPAEVVKQKLQAGMYTSAPEAIHNIWKQHGIKGFYSGYRSSISRDVPFRVAQLTTYEMAKSLYLKFKHSQRQRHGEIQYKNGDKLVADLTPAESAILGGFAGCVSSVLTQPMDRIRTLMMTNGAAYGYSMVSCFQTVLARDGIRGIYTGLVPRLAYVAPSVAIFFISYELTQQKLRHLQ